MLQCSNVIRYIYKLHCGCWLTASKPLKSPGRQPFSISEASSAVIEVGNTMFGRWKSAGESDKVFDKDTTRIYSAIY